MKTLRKTLLALGLSALILGGLALAKHGADDPAGDDRGADAVTMILSLTL